MAIMSEEARTKRISDAVQAQPADGERISLPWQDTPRILPVVKLELEALVLNPNSHRIRAQLESHPQRQLVKDSPYGEEAQEVIAELLSATEGFEDLKSNLREEGQRDAGVITHKGLLVNANSRLVAMRDLGQNYIRVAVLPKDATEAEITALELRLQMQRELKQEYTFTNELIFVEELISTYNRSPQEVALDLRWAASRAPNDLAKGRAQVEQASRLLSTIRDVQEISGNTIPLADFDQASVALKEIDQVYQELVKKDPERARIVRDTRLVGVLVGLGYRELRRVDEGFLLDYMIPAMEDSDLLRKHVPVLTSGSAAAGDEVPGLKILPAADSASAEEPDPAPLLALLAKSREESSIEMTGEDGPILLTRESVIDSLRTAMESAVEEAKADERAENRLQAPIDFLKESDRKLRKALESYERMRKAEDFDHGRFAYLVRKVARTVEQLKAEIEKHR